MVSNLIPKFIDRYDIQARLSPALLVLAPIGIVIVGLYGGNDKLLKAVLSCLGICGVAYCLCRMARDAGHKIQDDLFHKWGGAPTTQLLRHSNKHFDSHTKERIHDCLAQSFKPMPSADEEKLDSESADDFYRGATAWIKEKTRDTKKHSHLFRENIAFGFHRNALGLKWYGVSVAAICTIWTLGAVGVISLSAPYLDFTAFKTFSGSQIITLCVAIAFLFLWGFRVTEGAVKRAAFAYAERLWQCCDHLDKPRRKTPKATAHKPTSAE